MNYIRLPYLTSSHCMRMYVCMWGGQGGGSPGDRRTGDGRVEGGKREVEGHKGTGGGKL